MLRKIMTHERDLYFLIPTYRFRDVSATVEQYDEHFRRNHHAPKIIVFDDYNPIASEEYYPLLEQTKTHNDVYYVGLKEKEQFTAHLGRRHSCHFGARVALRFPCHWTTPRAARIGPQTSAYHEGRQE